MFSPQSTPRMSSPHDKPPRVSACVVTFNNAGCLASCLDALFHQEGVLTDAVVVDNASRDNSVEIASAYPGVRIVESSKNLGFAAGANTAHRLSQGSYILFLNPDVVMAPNCLRVLVDTLRGGGDDLAAVQPKLLRPQEDDGDGSLLDSTGMVLSLCDMRPHDRGFGEADKGQFDQAGDIFGPTAACALWRREILEGLTLAGELFDEAFFAYYEDLDLAWRARVLGCRFLYQPEALAEHSRKNPIFHGRQVEARAFANRYLALIKNADAQELLLGLFGAVFRDSPRWIYKTFTQPGFHEAWRQLARGILPALRKRKILRRMRARL